MIEREEIEFGYVVWSVGAQSYANEKAFRRLGPAAEDSGFDTLWVPDHITIPESIPDDYPISPDGEPRVYADDNAYDAFAVIGYVLVSGRPDGQVLLAFPLFFGAAIGFVQDRLRFCVAFGALARYDLAGSGGGAGSIAEREAVRRDRKRAVQVAGVALGVALAATALVYAVAVLSV